MSIENETDEARGQVLPGYANLLLGHERLPTDDRSGNRERHSGTACARECSGHAGKLAGGLQMNIEGRLSKLEAKAPIGDDWKVFRVIGDSAEECQAEIEKLIPSGEARSTDHFVSRIIVDPVRLR